MTKNRKPRLLAPVIARATLRLSPFAPSQRCQSVTVRKKLLTRCDPSPSTCPEEVFKNNGTLSRPKPISAGADGLERRMIDAGGAPRWLRAFAIRVSTGRWRAFSDDGVD